MRILCTVTSPPGSSRLHAGVRFERDGERTSTMSHFSTGLISAYNSLTDKHLTGYFSSARIRKHLQRAGLVTRSGRIVPDKEYKRKLLQRAHQRHVRECLAQAILLKVLEMERLHQMEMKRKLEEFARRERVHKMKPCSSRPNTAPGKMQRPARLKPIRSGSNKRSSPQRVQQALSDDHPPFNCTTERQSRKRETTPWDPPLGVSPYCLPVINNFVTPLPPATKRKARGPGYAPSGTPNLWGRRLLRTTTVSSAVDANEEQPSLRTSVAQSRVCVTMVYFGKSVRLSHDSEDRRDEVKVFQQHCGGENLCVYKGKLHEGETFQFVSRRHRGFPFSLTFFLNGLQVERLSSCCEFKRRRGPRLGGRHGHFGFSAVERASPCYKCIIAMGLDKMPTPPPKRVKEAEESVKEHGSTSHSGRCGSTSPQQEDKHRDDYEEDFEGDDAAAAADEFSVKKASPTSGTDARTKDETSSDSEDDGWDEDDDARRPSSSSSSEESDVDAGKDSRLPEEAEESDDVLRDETADEKEEDAAIESSTEVDVSDTGEKEHSREAYGENAEGEVTADGTKSGEPERAKSVQEKLAEAILQNLRSSSEPELSDTSAEEKEVASTDQGQKGALLAESKLEEASETKEHTKAGQEEPHENSEISKDKMGDSVKATEQEEVKVAEDGGDSEKTKRGEPQDNASAIAIDKTTVDADAEAKPASNTTETKAEETAEGSEIEVKPEDLHGLLEAREDDVKDERNRMEEVDEASGDIGATGEGRDDLVTKCEDHSKEQEEKIHPNEKPSKANEGSEKDGSWTEKSHKAEENTAEVTKVETQSNNEEAVATLSEEDKAGELEKTETDNGEGLHVKSIEAEEVHVEKADEVNTDNEEKMEAINQDGKQAEESKDVTDKDEAITTAQTEEGEERQDAVDKDKEEKIVTAEGREEINEETTDITEESNGTEKDENETQEIEAVTDKLKEENFNMSEVKEGEELDKAITDNKGDTEAIEEDENKAEENKDEEEKMADAQKKEGEEMSKANTDDMTQSEAVGNDKEDEQSKDITDKNKEIVTAHTEDGDFIKKATTDIMEESEMRQTNDNEAEESKAVTIKEGDEELTNAETKESDQKNEAIAYKSEESEHKHETKAEKSIHTTDEAEGEKLVTADTHERQETSKDAEEPEKTSDEHLRHEDEDIVTHNVGVFQAANEMSTTEETQADTVQMIGNGQRSKVDAENGAMSTQVPSIANGDKSDAKTSVQIEQRQPEEESPEHKGLEVKMEIFGDVHTLEGDAEVECNKNNLETLASGVDLIEDSESDAPNSSRHDSKVEKIKESPKTKAEPSSVVVDDAEKSSKEEEQEFSKLPSKDMVSTVRLQRAEARTEEASEASEEDASMLLQPKTQSNTQSINQLPHGESPEVLARASSSELVTNWLTMHQASNFFETFVEPLEDMRGSDVGVSMNVRQSPEFPKILELSHTEAAPKHVEEGNTKREAHSHPESLSMKDDSEKVSNEHLKHMLPKIENEPKLRQEDESEECLVEDKVGSTRVWRAATMSGTKPETVAEIIENGLHLDVEPTSTEDMNGSPKNDIPPADEKVEERTSPEGKMHEEVQEVTEVSHFTTSRSDVGSRVGVEGKPSVNGSARHMDDMVSQDRLSVLSVDKLPFAPSSYSLLASARTEGGH
ncbi:glutamate-rich protein 3 isoform X2 [Phyllopteryx taeniolatus]|uniref:glutamate-rich protein 3 isoform X2 n=1 Tax=Phyllopteryx taeniolatus TaxID=161469 RepID=UPI002AD20204|nr:glutamate-rich protein 3 isoform X2 [Phyllopteryx taeniolatus]